MFRLLKHDEPFEVLIDASDFAIGGVIVQKDILWHIVHEA